MHEPDHRPSTPQSRTNPAPAWEPADPAVLAQAIRDLRKRLHVAAPGAVCRCGACSHLLRVTETRLGAPPGTLRVRMTTKRPAPAPRPSPRPPLSSQVGSSAHVVVGGKRLTFLEGLSALAQERDQG